MDSPVSAMQHSRFENVLDHFIVGFLVIIVANVPQGLPSTVTSQLAIIARRMSEKNVFMKNLNVIDELGAATVICADKTGTLTQNTMVVTNLWYNRRHHIGELRRSFGNSILTVKCSSTDLRGNARFYSASRTFDSHPTVTPLLLSPSFLSSSFFPVPLSSPAPSPPTLNQLFLFFQQMMRR